MGKPVVAVKETEAPAPEPTPTEVVTKVSKGEKLTEPEKEVFKAIPVGGMPSSEPVEPPKEPVAEPEAKTEPEPPATAPETVSEDRKKLILQELEKPEEQVDLSKFSSQVELGLYWGLRKQRTRNSKLQDENDTLKVTRLIEDYNKTKTVEMPDAFADLQPDDVLSVQEVKDRIEKARKTAKPKEEPAEAPPGVSQMTLNTIRIQKVEADSRLRSKGITDFYDVVDYAGEALGGDQDASLILQEVAKAGGNVAEKTYWLIKGSERWSEIEKSLKTEKAPPAPTKAPPAEHVERAERLNNNSGKTVTTGAASGSAGVSKEYSLSEIASMTHSDVAKLPREVRQQILKKYGSKPNFSV